MTGGVKPKLITETISIREIRTDDLDAVVDLDARATGEAKREYWREAFTQYVGQADGSCAFGAQCGPDLIGYVMGEIRSWEFGSPPCGWIFALNVAPECREDGIGSQLFAAAHAAFRKAGVKSVRTMVARDSTLLMSFFRAQGMAAGPFVQLEMAIGESQLSTAATTITN
jgi:ribosomal protein S18 acetylase RimI-like enzyme